MLKDEVFVKKIFDLDILKNGMFLSFFYTKPEIGKIVDINKYNVVLKNNNNDLFYFTAEEAFKETFCFEIFNVIE